MLGFEQEENRWSYHGLSAAAFSEAPVGYDNFKITKDSIHEHFVTHLPKKVIEVRKASKGKLKGKKMEVPETKQYKELEQQVLSINQFLSTFTYEAMSFGGLRRIFNEGDVANFDFDRGGHTDGVFIF